eukprot:3714191-Prymnesium_polylepis.1
MSSVGRSSTIDAAMLYLLVRSATREGELPLADADGQPRCAAAKFRASGGRVRAAHATDGAGGPCAIKIDVDDEDGD